MKIDFYEPYHIGIKFANFINLKTLKIQLIELLEKKKYDVIKEEEILPLEKIKEYIAEKNKIKIQLFYPVIAVNIIKEITKSYQNAIESFHDILGILKELEYDLNRTILFYEIVTNITIKTDKKPIEVFDNSLSVNLGTFEDLGKISCRGLKFRSGKTEDEFLDLVFEPRLYSPENKYFLRMVYKTKKIDNVIKVHDDIEKNVINIMNLIEGD